MRSVSARKVCDLLAVSWKPYWWLPFPSLMEHRVAPMYLHCLRRSEYGPRRSIVSQFLHSEKDYVGNSYYAECQATKLMNTWESLEKDHMVRRAVTKNRHILTGDIVAIKCFLADDKDYAVVKKSVLVEVSALREVRHDNVVKLFHVFMEDSVFYMVFEYVSRTLLDVIHDAPKKCLGAGPRTKSFLFQLLRAIAFIHSKDYIHRDIKPENILITKDDILRVADFGFATKNCYSGQRFSAYIATRWYRAPELLTGDYCYGKAVDVWALGAVTVEMIRGQPLASGTDDSDQMVKTLQIVGYIPKYMWERAKKMYTSFAEQSNDAPAFAGLEALLCQYPARLADVIKLCLEPDPLIRHTADFLQSHAYFTEDDKYFIANLLTEIKQSAIESTHSAAVSYQHFLHKRNVFQRAARDLVQQGNHAVSSIISRYRQLGLDEKILHTMAELITRDRKMIPDFRSSSRDMYTTEQRENIGKESASFLSRTSLFPAFQFRSGSVSVKPPGYPSSRTGVSYSKMDSCLADTKSAFTRTDSIGSKSTAWPENGSKKAVSVIRGGPSSLQQSIRSKPAFIARKPTSTVSEVVHAAIDNNRSANRSASGSTVWYKNLAQSGWKVWQNRVKHGSTTSGQEGDASKHFRSDDDKWTFDEPLDLSTKRDYTKSSQKSFDIFADTKLVQCDNNASVQTSASIPSSAGTKWNLSADSDDEIQSVYNRSFLPSFHSWGWQHQN